MNLQATNIWVRRRYELALLAVSIGFIAAWGVNWFTTLWVSGGVAGLLFGGSFIVRFIRRYIWESAFLTVFMGFVALMGFPAGLTVGLVVGYVVLVSFIHVPLLGRGIYSGLVDTRREPLRFAVVAVICMLLAVWGVGFSGIALWALFLTWVLYRWDSRIVAFLALASLVSCPFLLILHQGAWAETMAEYAYLLLVITVSLQIIEQWRVRKNTPHDQA